MKRLILVAGLVLMGAPAAKADPCVISYGPTNPTYAPDDTAISLFFDAFFTTVTSAGTCAPSFAAHSNVPNDPDLFEVYSADIRGSFLVPGDEAEITVTNNGTSTTGTLVDDPASAVTHFIGKDADGNLSSEIGVVLTVAGDPASELEITTIDYALAGTMTRADAEISLTEVNLAGAGLVTHLGGMNTLLTGGNLAVEGENEVGVFAAVGSYDLGVRGRYNLTEGVSLLGGVSLVDFATTNATARGAAGALAVRYLDPAPTATRLYAEAGVEASLLTMSFTRSYVDSLGPHTVAGTGTGGIGGVYGKAGVLWAPDASNEVLLSATLRGSSLGVGNYSEPVSLGNLFAADLGGSNTLYTTAKVNVDWTAALASDVDLTASAGLGTTFANSGTTANIMGGGPATGGARSTVFAEYGLRLGWKPTATATIDGFVHGTTGTGIGTHVQLGAAARMRF
jgi:hypothetical protein